MENKKTVLMKKKFKSLFITCLLISFANFGFAQLNYQTGGFSTFSSTYTDLGATGTAVTMTDNDTGHSNVSLPIGFTLNFNGSSYTKFVMYVDGFLKLGNSYADTVSSAYNMLFSTFVQPPSAGPFNSINPLDTSLVFPFGQDLWPGTNTADFRYITTGTAGSRVCTIQWKNLKDKLQNAVTSQYDTINFQVKLYETSNAIEFIYGPWGVSTNASNARFGACGLKGNNTTTYAQLITLTKASSGAFSTATANSQASGSPLGNYTTNALNYGNNVSGARPAPDLGRVYHFNPIVLNDAAVRAVYASGKIALPYYTTDSIRANVYNPGVNAQTSLVVTLHITGANTYTNTTTIPSLASGANINVGFAPYTPVNAGQNLISVSVPSDGNNLNNTATYGMSVSNNYMAYTDTTQGISQSYGSTLGTVWANRFKVNGSAMVTQVRSFVASNSLATGDTVCGMVLNMSGTIIGRSPNYIVTAADLGTYLIFNITTPPVVTNSLFLAGIAQGNSASTYFMGSVQNEIPTRYIDTTSYQVSNSYGISNATVGSLFGTPSIFSTPTSNYRLMMECTVIPIISGNTISASQNIVSGGTPAALTGSLPTGGIGSYTYLWQSSTTSATAGFAAASGTNNTQNYTPPALTVPTWYRRVVTAGMSDSSALVFINIRAPLNYQVGGFSTFTSTYTDLGATGTAITMNNTDTGHSAAVSIGFPFTYNGAFFSSFVMYVDGFIKLGNSSADTVSSAANMLFTSFVQPPGGGPFNSVNSLDTNLIVPFGQDLYPGTNTADFRVSTTGTAGSRVCTIQWKNLKDKLQQGVATQYDTINFQVKLYETSNAIEFVYGNWVASTNVSTSRFAACGLKGIYLTGAAELLTVTKGSTVAWSGSTPNSQASGSPLGNYTVNAMNYGNLVSGTRPAPDAGRVFHFNRIVTNDAAVRAVYAMGKIAKPYYVADSIRANIYNPGINAQTSLVVTLNITGANTYTTTATIPSLASGASVNVGFAPYTTVNNGANLISVSVPADSNNLNNVSTYGMTVGNNFMTYTDSLQGVGQSYGSTIGTVWANRFKVNGTAMVTQVRSFIVGNSAAAGDTVCGMVLSTTGTILGRSPNYIVTAADLGTYLTFNITTPPVITNSYFLAGIAGGNSTATAFLGAVQNEIPTRYIDTTSYQVSNSYGISTATVGSVFGTPSVFSTPTSNYRLMMECTVYPLIAGNTISASQSICTGSIPAVLTGSLPTGGTGAYTYSWLSSTTSATAGFAVASGTNNTQNYTPGLLAQTTWYRRVVTSGLTDTATAVQITINPVIAGNTTGTFQTICSGSSPATITGSTPTGGSGTYTYSWLSSATNPASGFAVATGTNNTANYSASSLAATTWYRRLVTSGGCIDTTVAVTVNVTAAISGNTASGTQTVCTGSAPAGLTGSTPTGGSRLINLYEDFNGGNAPGSWSLVNASSLLVSQSTLNSFARTGTTGAYKADNWDVSSGSTALLTSKVFSSSQSGDSLRFDVASMGYNTSYDSLIIFTSNGSGFNRLQGFGITLTVDTASGGITTVAATGSAFTPTTASQWYTKRMAIPVGTIQVQFKFYSNFGDNFYIDQVRVDSSYNYLWQSSTTSATGGFSAAAGTNNTQGYTPSPSLSQTSWFRRVTSSGACSADTTTAVQVTITNTNSWNGVTSTAWATPTNWGCGRIPISTDSVVIAPSANQPIIIDGGRLSNSLTINSSASLTINNAASLLTIGNIFTNNGTLSQTNGEIVFGGTSAQTIPAGTYNRLTVNNAAGVSLGGNITLNDSLKLNNGNVNLGAYNLTLAGTTGIVNNASATRYIVNTGTGALTIQGIGSTGRTGAVTFPVGKSTYDPATITNTGTNDNFTVSLIDSVTNNYTGNTPTGLKLTTGAVGKTWIINEGTAGGSNATITLQWNAADELPSFTRASSYLAKYNGTTWVSATATGASGANPYTQTRTGITTFSAFGVGSGGTLPVELISFKGMRYSNTVELNWSTASELNNDHFIIERSTDNSSFEFVGNVKGNGTTELINQYDLKDDVTALIKQKVPVVYYRLKQVDLDGKVSDEGIVAVNITNLLSGIIVKAEPNPFNASLNVNVNISEDDHIQLQVIDLTGRLIFEQNASVNAGDNLIEIRNADQLKDGMYFINVITSKSAITQKVLKGN